MKNTDILKYEPLMVVTTFSGKQYYFPKSHYDLFQQTLEKKKFVDIQGSTVNVSSIDTVDPAGQSGDFVENMLKQLPLDVQRSVRFEIKARKSKVHTELTEGTLRNIINKFTNPE